MMRKVRFVNQRLGLALLALALPLVLAAAAGGQQSIAPEPSSKTAIVPASAQACALLDIPEKRFLMDGLLFNLLWSCGRQNELGFDSSTERSAPPAKVNAGDVQVNDSTGETGSAVQNETSIVRNPVTGTLCSAFNDSWEYYSGGGGFTGFSRSTDNGATWTDGGAVGATSLGDPSLVWRAADGYFYLGTLASGGSLAVWVSTDDCQSFNFLSTPSTGSDDKELLAVDNNPASPYYGNLYLVWTDFGVSGIPIRATRSTDGGATWLTPVTISNGGTVQGAWPAVAPNGDVYVAWLRYASWPTGNVTVEVERSTNGGASYSPVTSPLSNAVSPRDASASSTCGRPALRGNIRYLASPQIAVSDDGALHVVYSYDPDGHNTGDVVDVFYRRSTNNGSSWAAELRLNDDATTRDQFFPTLAVEGSTVMTAWYDRRNDSGNTLVEYYKRISTDGGLTWSANETVSDTASPIVLDSGTAWCYHGDYDQSLIADDGSQVAQWGDDRNGTSDVWSDVAPGGPPGCVIDVAGGSHNCDGTPVTLTTNSGIYRVARIDMTGFVRLDAILDLCSPTGYTHHFADSPTCNGFGGDGGTANHNAEAHNSGANWYFYGVDPSSLPRVVETGVLATGGCYQVHYAIQEDRLRFDDDGDPADSFRIDLTSYDTFELAPYAEADAEDPSGADANLWYVGLNRTVASSSRSGTGVDRACFVLSDTTNPDPAVIASQCAP